MQLLLEKSLFDRRERYSLILGNEGPFMQAQAVPNFLGNQPHNLPNRCFYQSKARLSPIPPPPIPYVPTGYLVCVSSSRNNPMSAGFTKW
jgi:hypothetical protein